MEFDTDPYKGDNFFGSITSRQVGQVTIYNVKAQPHNAHHPKPIAFSGENTYIVAALQIQGECHVFQGGRSVIMEPGDFTLLDTSQAFDLKCPKPMEHYTLRIPWDKMRQDLISPEKITGTAIRGSDGIGAIASGFLRSFVENSSKLNETEVNSLTYTLVGILNTAAFSHIGKQVRETSESHDFQLQQIRLYLEENLREQDLSAEKVAMAHGITTRYLHKLFEVENISFNRFIWDRRIEHCKRDLENPYMIGKSISDIAYSWGFNSSSHFSRLFKKQYSISPRALRKSVNKS